MSSISMLHDLKRVLFSILVSGIVFSSAVSAQSAALSEIKTYMTSPKQVGEGTLTYYGFKVYDAAYYISDEVGNPSFALRLNYARKILSEDLVQATVKQMNLLGASPNDIVKWQAELEKIYPSVEPGHLITAIYQGNGTTTFLHNGKPTGRVSDPQFSKVFFGIWLDPKTSSPKLRAKLLGELCPPSMVTASCIK